MKIKILFILAFISSATFAQDFAPVGAKWYYSVYYAYSWPGEQTYMTVNASKDTIIDSKNCTELDASWTYCGSYSSNKCWVYYNDSIVYFYDSSIGFFQILYNFKALVNDTWEIAYPTQNLTIDTMTVSLDSIGIMNINSIPLKTLYVTYKSKGNPFIFHNSRIVERIGDFGYLFNFNDYQTNCDADYMGGLRCYEDSSFGFYSTGIADSCDYVYIVGINDEVENIKDYLLYPNPTSDYINIKSNCNSENRIIELYDSFGRLIETMTFSYQTKINLTTFSSGLYFINIIDNNNKLTNTYKIIKN